MVQNTHLTELHVLLIVNGRHGDLALGHIVVVIDVVAESAHFWGEKQ